MLLLSVKPGKQVNRYNSLRVVEAFTPHIPVLNGVMRAEDIIECRDGADGLSEPIEEWKARSESENGAIQRVDRMTYSGEWVHGAVAV